MRTIHFKLYYIVFLFSSEFCKMYKKSRLKLICTLLTDCPVKRVHIKFRRGNIYLPFISLSIHLIRRFTILRCSSAESSRPLGTRYHFSRQPLQQQAQACWAMNMGCPRMGVCLPSLCIAAGARRLAIKSSPWLWITSMPFSRTYSLSFWDR